MFCNTIKESNCFKGSGKCLDLMLASSKSFSKYPRIVETGLNELNLTIRLFTSCFKHFLKILNQILLTGIAKSVQKMDLWENCQNWK